jgi:hypothetical protein
MNRRIALSLILVALLAIGATIVVTRKLATDDSVVDKSYARDAYPIVIQDLCKSVKDLDAGNRTDAYNSFYRRAHPALHALSADVGSRGAEGKKLSGHLRRSKSKVEAGLLNGSTTLSADFVALIRVTSEGLKLVQADTKFNAPLVCEPTTP